MNKLPQISAKNEGVERDVGKAVAPQTNQLETVDQQRRDFVGLGFDVHDVHAGDDTFLRFLRGDTVLQFVRIVVAIVAVQFGVEKSHNDRSNHVVHSLAVAEAKVIVADLPKNRLENRLTAILLAAKEKVVRECARDVS